MRERTLIDDAVHMQNMQHVAGHIIRSHFEGEEATIDSMGKALTQCIFLR